jgi:zinc/manganese transport system permease protein
MAASAAIGTVTTWIGILLAYDSFYWPPSQHGWPVSFFVVALVVIAYLLSYARRARRRPDAAEERANQREETPTFSPA